jgi:fructose-bisphosphate aldolase class II
MHQDHGVSPAVCQRSIQLGFSSVMMDGSLAEDGKTPTDFDYNVRVTKQTVDMAHACGVSGGRRDWLSRFSGDWHGW